ncbi:MAG: hypothetical protein RR951_10005, partial [Ruthenibacterium sp.]
MEKKELQRKVIATVLATLVLCALLGVSIWLLLTTDVFTSLIKGLMIVCCVLLAAAIGGFLRNKIVEIRTLRLCLRDRVADVDYDDFTTSDSIDTMTHMRADEPDDFFANDFSDDDYDEDSAYEEDDGNEGADFFAETDDFSDDGEAFFDEPAPQPARPAARSVNQSAPTRPAQAPAAAPIRQPAARVPLQAQQRAPQTQTQMPPQ